MAMPSAVTRRCRALSAVPVLRAGAAWTGPASRRDGQLLAGELERQGTGEIHRRQRSMHARRSKAGRSSMRLALTGSALRR
jgi:hypothetical protein